MLSDLTKPLTPYRVNNFAKTLTQELSRAERVALHDLTYRPDQALDFPAVVCNDNERFKPAGTNAAAAGRPAAQDGPKSSQTAPAVKL